MKRIEWNNMYFKSIQALAKYLNMNSSNLRNNYIDTNRPLLGKHINILSETATVVYKDRVFKNMRELAKHLNISAEHLYRIKKSAKPYKGGYIVDYSGIYKEPKIEKKKWWKFW